MSNSNYWIQYLTPELMYEFIKEHFEDGTYAPSLEEFKKSIVEPCVKNGYTKQVNLLKGKNKGNFYACVLFGDHTCKVVSKNHFLIFKGERNVKGAQAQKSHNYKTVLVNYQRLMIKTCGPEYRLELMELYRSNWAQREVMHSLEIQKATEELKKKHVEEYEIQNLTFKKVFDTTSSLKPIALKLE